MPLPSESYMTLVGGLNSGFSTIYTNSVIKIGDLIKLSGTASNNGVFTVTDIISTGSTGEGVGTTFTDDTRSGDILSGTTIIMDGANTNLVAGLSVSGTNIQEDTYISSVTSTSDPATFVISKSVGGTVSGGTTLTFGDMDIYYTLKGGILTDENTAGSTDPEIEVIRAPGDKLMALGDVDSARGIDVWSNNATTDYLGTSPASANGWEESAINPTLNGNNAKYIYHFGDEALRVCNINEQNTSLVKWYGYIQRQQFNNQKGLIFAEWQEHPNNLATPKLATSFTYAYGHTTHDGSDNAASYYQNNRGVARIKTSTVSASTTNLRINGSHNDSTTSFTFENSNGSSNILDQAVTGEVITIDEALGARPKEYLFCKKESGTSGGTITYSRSYGGALGGTAPDSYSDQDTPIIERGLGFNIAIDDGTGDGDWEEGTYEFYQTFIYDGNQESLPAQMGNGASTIVAFTHASDGQKAFRVSVFADVAYNGRITGGRVYTRFSETDDDLILLIDIDIVKGVRTTLDGDHVAWTYDDDDGYYVEGAAVGNISEPNLDTYTTINGFSPDVNFVALGGIGELYKSSVVANRRTFIANVKTKGKGGELEKFGDRLMYSEIGKFDTFLEHNFIDVSKGDYGEYTALEAFADRLLAFKHNLVHIINIASPSVANWYLEDTVKYFGVNHPFSVARTKYGIAWVSDDGCYLYDGSRVRNLIDKKIAVSEASFLETDVNWQGWYRGTALVKDVMLGYDSISNSLIMIRSPDDASNDSNTGWIYDFDSNGWSYHTTIFTDDETYTNFVTDWNNNLTLGFQDGSNITFQKFLPVGQAKTDQEFNTKDIDFGQPGLIKKIYKVTMTYKSTAEQQTPLYYATDGTQSFSAFATGTGVIPQGSTGGAGYLESTASSGTRWDIATFTPSSPVSCQSIQFQLDLPSSGTFEVNDITVEYRTIRNKNVS